MTDKFIEIDDVLEHGWLELREDYIKHKEHEELKKVVDQMNKFENTNISLDFEINENINDEKCLESIINCFAPTVDNVNLMRVLIENSPFSREVLYKHLHNWYFSKPHKNQNTIEGYMNCYFKESSEKSNKWFWCLVKRLPEDIANQFRNKFGSRAVDRDVKFDIWDDFGLSDLRDGIDKGHYHTYAKCIVKDKKLVKKARELNEKKYDIVLSKIETEDDTKIVMTINKFPQINIGKLITDLKRCFVIINTAPKKYYFKDFDTFTKRYCLAPVASKEIAIEQLEPITINYLTKTLEEKSVSLWQMIMKNNIWSAMAYENETFYSEHPKVFSRYYKPFDKDTTEYKIDDTKTDYKSMNNEEKFLFHIKEVICDGNQEMYEYYKRWIALPLQNPTRKNKTALLIRSDIQGSGKSWFSEIVCRLHGKFGVENISEMENITGKFNGIMHNKTLVVVNEVPQLADNLEHNTDKIKTLITDDKIDFQFKNKNQFQDYNHANFIFVSNNPRPLKFDNSDRRFAVCEPSGKYGTINGAPNEEYWNPIYGLKDNLEFLTHLYNYFVNLDLSGFNPAKIPMSESKMKLMELNRPRWEKFIIDNLEVFKKGISLTDGFEKWCRYCEENKYTSGNSDTLRMHLDKYMQHETRVVKTKTGSTTTIHLKRIRFANSRVQGYQLMDEYYEKFAAEVIDEKDLPLEEDE